MNTEWYDLRTSLYCKNLDLQRIVDEKNQAVSSLREEVATLRRMYTELMDKYQLAVRKPPTSTNVTKLPNISV